jgi:hypothetical protein
MKSIFTIGEDIHIQIHYKNPGFINIERTNISVKRTITFKDKKSSKNELVDSVKLIEEVAKGVSKHSDVTINHTMKVPQTNSSFDESNSCLLQVFHFLVVEAHGKGFNNNVVVNFPIKICEKCDENS